MVFGKDNGASGNVGGGGQIGDTVGAGGSEVATVSFFFSELGLGLELGLGKGFGIWFRVSVMVRKRITVRVLVRVQGVGWR
jgi:hypothetical protein